MNIEQLEQFKLNDEKLSSFFYDLKNIQDYKDTFNGIDNLYKECVSIIEKREFLNINKQDNEGNTYLHYVCKDSNWNWAIKLLELGADPTIKNNVGKNIFRVTPISGGAVNLWKKIGSQGFSNFNNWENISKGYCSNAKQVFFDYFLKNNYRNFETEGEVVCFLKRNKIFNDKNLISLMTNIGMNLKREPFIWFKNKYPLDDPKINNHFFISYLSDKTYFINRAEHVIEFLSEKTIEQTESVSHTIFNIIWEAQKYQSKSDNKYISNHNQIIALADKIIEYVVNKQFNLEKNIVTLGMKSTSLKEEIEKTPLTFQMLLNHNLNKNKQIKKIKPIKI